MTTTPHITTMILQTTTLMLLRMALSTKSTTRLPEESRSTRRLFRIVWTRQLRDPRMNPCAREEIRWSSLLIKESQVPFKRILRSRTNCLRQPAPPSQDPIATHSITWNCNWRQLSCFKMVPQPTLQWESLNPCLLY